MYINLREGDVNIYILYILIVIYKNIFKKRFELKLFINQFILNGNKKIILNFLTILKIPKKKNKSNLRHYFNLPNAKIFDKNKNFNKILSSCTFSKY